MEEGVKEVEDFEEVVRRLVSKIIDPRSQGLADRNVRSEEAILFVLYFVLEMDLPRTSESFPTQPSSQTQQSRYF